MKTDGNSNTDSFFRVTPVRRYWIRFWMRWAGLGRFGRVSSWLAALPAPPHKAGIYLAKQNPKGFIAPDAVVYHPAISMGRHILISNRVVLYQNKDGGLITIGHRVAILRDSAIETGWGGRLEIGDDTWIQPRCQINAYKGNIHIGRGVDIAPNCALYSYDHGFAPGSPIRGQALTTKGDIIIGNDSWLGVGVTVLSGVTIGNGAVVGAGSVVDKDIPEGGIAAGVPARLLKRREDLERKEILMTKRYLHTISGRSK